MGNHKLLQSNYYYKIKKNYRRAIRRKFTLGKKKREDDQFEMKIKIKERINGTKHSPFFTPG